MFLATRQDDAVRRIVAVVSVARRTARRHRAAAAPIVPPDGLQTTCRDMCSLETPFKFCSGTSSVDPLPPNDHCAVGHTS